MKPVYAVVAASGILLGAIYMLHMAGRVLFGPPREPGHGFDSSTGLTQDLTRREVGVLAPIALACLFLGVYPKPVMKLMEPSLNDTVLTRVLGPVSEVAVNDAHDSAVETGAAPSQARVAVSATPTKGGRP